MPRPSKFSMVDVSVAVLILVLVAGLALPWLQSHRIGHRGRSQQANHIKQIALAVHNYNDIHNGKLPPLIDVGTNAPIGAGLNSLFFNILPFIEHEVTFRRFVGTTPSYANLLPTGSQLGGAAGVVIG